MPRIPHPAFLPPLINYGSEMDDGNGKKRVLFSYVIPPFYKNRFTSETFHSESGTND